MDSFRELRYLHHHRHHHHHHDHSHYNHHYEHLSSTIQYNTNTNIIIVALTPESFEAIGSSSITLCYILVAYHGMRNLIIRFPMCQGLLSFLSAPLIGALSDVWGRRPFLFLTVTFTCAPIPLMKLMPWLGMCFSSYLFQYLSH